MGQNIKSLAACVCVCVCVRARTRELMPNIPKTAKDTGSVPIGIPIENDIWQIDWSRELWHHVT